MRFLCDGPTYARLARPRYPPIHNEEAKVPNYRTDKKMIAPLALICEKDGALVWLLYYVFDLLLIFLCWAVGVYGAIGAFGYLGSHTDFDPIPGHYVALFLALPIALYSIYYLTHKLLNWVYGARAKILKKMSPSNAL